MTFARLGPSSRTVALLFSVPVAALAQTGRITGTVTDMGAAPLVGAQVLLATVGMAAKSGDEGKFTIRTVPVGTYDLTVIRLGFKPAAVTGVLVRDGVETTLAIHLERDAVQLAGVVTTGARRTQKVTDAPGTITVLDTSAVSGTIGNSYFPVLKEAKGIEFLQAGVTSVFINARGFNSSFNTRMLYVEDGRIAVLHTGLPLGPFTTIPKLDLASVEVLAGPGSALYGPDASNGIVLLTSKDPRQFPGWATEVSGGTRNFYSAQGRYASTRGPWSYKIAAEYQAADDWRNIVYYPAVTAGGAPVLERGTDFRTDVARGTASLAFYTRDDARVQLTVGASKRNGIGLTAPGRSQHSNIVYRDYQLEFTGSRWFAQVYHTNANAGSSYGLGNFSQNLVKLPTASFDSVKKLSVMPGDGRIYAAEVQNNFTLGMLGKTGITAIDRAHVVWGGQFRHDRVSSYQQYLSDRRTGKAIETSQRGAYAQVEMPLARMLAVVVAGRYDTHDRWSPQFSPKAGLLFAAAPNQTVRLTYNRAFKTPFIIQTDVYQQNANNSVSFGNSGGVDIKNAAGTLLRTIDPIKPETNVTWELGYKGVIGGKLYADVTGYRSRYKDFLSPAVVVANPFAAGAAATFGFDRRTGTLVADASGRAQTVLSYFNLAQATMSGADIGLRYYLTDRVSAWTNASFIRLDTIETKPTDPPDATAMNSSSSRMTVGMSFRDYPSSVNSGFTIRYVNAYDFRYGVHYGRIPTYGTLDVNASYRIRGSAASLMFQAQNLFVCVGGTTTPPPTGIALSVKATYTPGRKCGFGQSHQELLNTPSIGPMAFLGIRWEGR